MQRQDRRGSDEKRHWFESLDWPGAHGGWQSLSCSPEPIISSSQQVEHWSKLGLYCATLIKSRTFYFYIHHITHIYLMALQSVQLAVLCILCGKEGLEIRGAGANSKQINEQYLYSTCPVRHSFKALHNVCHIHPFTHTFIHWWHSSVSCSRTRWHTLEELGIKQGGWTQTERKLTPVFQYVSSRPSS